MHEETGLHVWLDPLWETLHITFFVMIVMMLMEFVELYRMRRKKELGLAGRLAGGGGFRHFLQIVVAALLGMIPGCVGGFVAVSLYAHRVFSFGAVFAASMTALGDDAFRMLASEPLFTLQVELVLLAGGIVLGYVVDLLGGKALQAGAASCHIELHDADQEGKGVLHVHSHAGMEAGHAGENGKEDKFWPALKDWSFSRALLVVLLLLYVASLVAGFPGHVHGHEEEHVLHFGFENIVSLLLSLAALILEVFVNEHFLQEHLWNHLLKKHFPAIFLWTLGTLYLITLLQLHFDLHAWLAADTSRSGLLVLAAILVGWIPQSGPHYLFIQLYFSSVIPASVFWANAIVQDGHTSLLLLAESRRKYVLLKSIKSGLALLVALILSLL